MNNFTDTIKFILGKRAYGVCSYLGELMGISSSRIRLYFIYSSFFAFGSPLIIYLIVAFWMNIKNYIRQRRNIIWEK